MTLVFDVRYCQFQSTLPVWGATKKATEKTFAELFQSTLPVWGATRKFKQDRLHCINFNPRSPCGERPEAQTEEEKTTVISIHAPRVGSDDDGYGFAVMTMDISIHAPRVGSD